MALSKVSELSGPAGAELLEQATEGIMRVSTALLKQLRCAPGPRTRRDRLGHRVTS